MPAYLTVDAFKNLSVMPSAFVDELERREPGFVEAQLERLSAWIDTRLRKRYAAPFAAPVPAAVQGWLADLATERCYVKRGYSPQDEQSSTYASDAATARAEIQQAADAQNGLFDLPLRQDTTASGIVKGAPLAYTEASPYVFTDEQGRTGHAEDANGSGSYG